MDGNGWKRPKMANMANTGKLAKIAIPERKGKGRVSGDDLLALPNVRCEDPLVVLEWKEQVGGKQLQSPFAKTSLITSWLNHFL